MAENLIAVSAPPEPGLLRSAHRWYTDIARRDGYVAANHQFISAIFEFLCDSTPARRRQRYGDADYDWEHRVNTTSAAMGWRDRLWGVFHSPYQPTEPALFHEMLEALRTQAAIDFHDFIFVDIGSGKGRALLMAADYPFRRIVGVELLPALHRIAQENIGRYNSGSQKCFVLEAICGDAAEFALPNDPTVLYLFNPLPESGLRRVLSNLQRCLHSHPRKVYVLYHNLLLGHVLRESDAFEKIGGTHQYTMYSSR
jgi:SAM-dependent methyltransferase